MSHGIKRYEKPLEMACASYLLFGIVYLFCIESSNLFIFRRKTCPDFPRKNAGLVS